MARPNLGYKDRLDVMIDPERREAYARAAELDGRSLSEWVRRALDHASGLAERRIQRVAKRTIPISWRHADGSTTTVGPRGGVRRRR